MILQPNRPQRQFIINNFACILYEMSSLRGWGELFPPWWYVAAINEIKSNKQFHHVSNQLLQVQIALLKYLPNVIWSNFIDDFLTNKKILKCFIDKWWIKLDSKNSWGVSRIIDKLLYLFFETFKIIFLRIIFEQFF